MSRSGAAEKPHAVCIPFPAEGHINPMMKLAKLLHSKGFHVTFVHSEHNQRRLLKSRGPGALTGLDDFRFETIPDGLPPADLDATQGILSLCESTSKNCLAPFRCLVANLNGDSNAPPVTCIVADGTMTFTLEVADELRIPEVIFWTTSACGFMAYFHIRQLMERGLTPLKDVSDLSNGFLDTPIDWMPGMNKNMRFRDLPSFVRTTNPDDFALYFINRETQRVLRAAAIVFNTFDDLECEVLNAMALSMSTRFPRIYSVGPLSLLSRQKLSLIVGSSLWKEEPGCLQWLEGREPGSVFYVNFGSITVMSKQQLVVFARGLARSNKDFLWVIRPDLVRGDLAVLPPEFLAETAGRGLLASWCPQEEVLSHPSVGGFLTHCGWNSTLESLCGGVPMICWPFFADQQTNCRYACTEWGVGVEIDNDVKTEEVEDLIREIMEGEKGKEMRRRALEWKELAARATHGGGSSHFNFNSLVNDVLLSRTSP